MGKLIIDGVETEAEPSKTVLEVARELGIHIPTLCSHPSLPPYGSCRICVVEAIWKGRSKLHTACTFPAWEGEIRTDSEPVRRLRRNILELMLAEAPEAEDIRALAREYGVEQTRFPVRQEKENKKCIMCGLCVRVCQDVVGFGAIGFENRGYRREIAGPFREPSDACTACGACSFVCPTGAIDRRLFAKVEPKPIPSEFDQGTTCRPCIYTPFPQAVPNKPVIDTKNCVYFKNGNCQVCAKVCVPRAVDYEQQDEVLEEEVGAIVVATGFDLFDMKTYGSYGLHRHPDVMSGLDFERLLSASGPTKGEVRRPSDGKVPKRVIFVKCAGSRDAEKGMPYCSKVCCMYSAKHAILYKHRVPDGEALVFYIDVRTAGKDFEEFYKRATDEGVNYVRGKVSKVFRRGDKMVVWGSDTISGRKLEVEADLVVLATAMVPDRSAFELARMLKIQHNAHGFFTEAHPKLRPVETATAGFFLAGAAQGPKDIPETVAQASASASKVLELFSRKELTHDPTVAAVDEELCSGCGICVDVCPYKARELVERKDGKGWVIKVTEVLCEGCGACSAACPVGACQQANLRDKQIEQMARAGLKD